MSRLVTTSDIDSLHVINSIIDISYSYDPLRNSTTLRVDRRLWQALVEIKIRRPARIMRRQLPGRITLRVYLYYSLFLLGLAVSLGLCAAM